MDWSPDGQTILTALVKKDRTAQIGLVSVSDGAMRVLKSFDWRAPRGMRFSPDGRWIVYGVPQEKDEPARDLYLLATDGSREVPLVRHPADDHLLGWAPYGDRVLFASDRRGTWDAFAIQVAEGQPKGQAELVKVGIGMVGPQGFSRSGAFFYSLRPQSRDVYVAELDPVSMKVVETPTKVTQRFEGHNETPDWSLDLAEKNVAGK